MKAADFLKQTKVEGLCGYLKTTMKDGNSIYKCGHPSGKLGNAEFDEPCTTEVWNNCLLNLKIPKAEILSLATDTKSLPDPGSSVEFELPDALKQFGTKYTIEQTKDGEFKVFKIDIYPSETLGKPPKVKFAEVI